MNRDYIGYGDQDPHHASREFLFGLQEDDVFIDVYRFLHPYDLSYTWRKSNEKRSRIDIALANQNLISVTGMQAWLLYASPMWHLGPGPIMYMGPGPIPSIGPDLLSTSSKWSNPWHRTRSYVGYWTSCSTCSCQCIMLCTVKLWLWLLVRSSNWCILHLYLVIFETSVRDGEAFFLGNPTFTYHRSV